MIISWLPLLFSKTSTSLLDSEQRPSDSQGLVAANRDGDIIDLMKPTAKVVMNALHGASFFKLKYKAIDLTAE